MMATASRRRSESGKGTEPEANMSGRNMSSTQRVDGGGTVEAQSDMARMMERLSRATESVLVSEEVVYCFECEYFANEKGGG